MASKRKKASFDVRILVGVGLVVVAALLVLSRASSEEVLANEQLTDIRVGEQRAIAFNTSRASDIQLDLTAAPVEVDVACMRETEFTTRKAGAGHTSITTVATSTPALVSRGVANVTLKSRLDAGRWTCVVERPGIKGDLAGIVNAVAGVAAGKGVTVPTTATVKLTAKYALF